MDLYGCQAVVVDAPKPRRCLRLTVRGTDRCIVCAGLR